VHAWRRTLVVAARVPSAPAPEGTDGAQRQQPDRGTAAELAREIAERRGGLRSRFRYSGFYR